MFSLPYFSRDPAYTYAARATIYDKTKKEISNEISFFVVRSTGIEDIRRYEKSLDFQGFFAIERQRGHQKILILQTANRDNEDTVFTLIGIRRGGDNH